MKLAGIVIEIETFWRSTPTHGQYANMIVQLPNGKPLEITMPWSEDHKLEMGDTFVVTVEKK